jgi:hypothetical protein
VLSEGSTPLGFRAWGESEAKAFLKQHAPKFARYRELVSGLEITPAQLS